MSSERQKLRIAFILGVFPAISETFILNQITGLIDLGHEVDIFSRYRSNSVKTHGDVYKYGLADRTRYLESPAAEPPRGMNLISPVIRHFYKNPGSVPAFFRVLKYRLDTMSMRALPSFLSQFNGNKYDIIHSHFGLNGNLGALLKELSVISGKLVTTFHGYDIRYGLKYGACVYEILRVNGDLFVAISRYNRRQLENLGFEPGKITYHPVGIDLDKFRFHPRERNVSRRGQNIRILTVARLVKEKGIEYGIRSVRELITRNPLLRIEYNIVGDGVLRERLKSLTADAGLDGVVRFLGEMDQSEVSAQLREADIFLLPSVDEALPVSLMEAQATGLPVVSTDVGGVSEIVADGMSGYIVPPHDVQALTEKLERLIRNPETWPEMGLYGNKIVEENYNVRELNRKLVEEYYSLISSNSP